MSTIGTERYNRIMLTLMKGGTKLTRRLVEKRVRDLSNNGEEDTIDDFLLKKKDVIKQTKLGKNKENVFFPPSGHTNLDYWDLCMFCCILEETCDLSNVTKMRIQKLLKIRNKLCHLNEPTLEEKKFDEYTDHLKVSFEKCLEEINDIKFTDEMNALVKSLANDPLSIDDTLLKAIHNLYRSEWTQREVLEKLGNGQDLTNRHMKTLLEKVERLESRFPSGSSVDIPGIGMGIEVENCSAEEEKTILDTLEKYFNEVIEQKVCPEEDLPNGVMHTVRESVRQVFQDFLRRGRHITIVEQKCLLLTIECASVKSFLDMIRDYRTGDLSLQLSGIETAIKNLQGCGNVQLVNFIFKEEFIEVMDDLVSKLCKRVQETEHTAVQTSSNSENSIRVTLKFPTTSERETVQNRFETKLAVDKMNRIESDLRRMLNEERMSLTDKLVVKDDTVSSFAQQSDTPVVDENATVEEESQTIQSKRKASLCEKEDTSIPCLRRDSQLTFNESTTRGKGTQISFDDKNEDREMIKTLPALANKTMSDVSERYNGLDLFKKPQCLLETDEYGFLTIVKKTADQMKQITSPVNVVAIAGLYRTGKSYLMNRLAGHTAGFAIGNAIQSETKGIWAWCREHPTQEDQVLLLLDTEGLGDGEKGCPDHDNKIFIIATLLSSTLVYNMMTAFNQDAIEKLTFITKLSENLKMSATDTTDDNFDLLMPDFVLCIRDFTLVLKIDGKECSEDEYFEHCLKEKRTQNNDLDEAYNRPRLCIKKYFTKRKAFTFDRPASRNVMTNLEQAKEEDLSSEFIQETKMFIAYVYDRPPKMLQNKQLVTGRMLLELLDAFVTAIKNGTVPCIDDAVTVMSKQENERYAKDAIDSFRDELGKLKMPVGNKTQLIEKKFSQSSILTDLNSKLLFDDNHAVELAVKVEMEKIFKEFEAENDKQVYEKCMMRITDIYKEVKNKIDRRTYMVSGGFEKYKKDMQSVVEMYENDQGNENIDRMQINKAKRDFLAERQVESEAIMTADRSISEQEQKDELEKLQKKLEADFREAQEKAVKHSQEEIERQRKQFDRQLALARNAQEENEAANKTAFLEERLARRRDEIRNMTTKLARLEDRLEGLATNKEPEKEEKGDGCSVS